jgi:hypothetical protein
MLYGPGMPCLDPDKPLTRAEWEEIDRELHPEDYADEGAEDDAEEE